MCEAAPDGTVVAANPAYDQIYGYSPEQVLGQRFAIIFRAAQYLWVIEHSMALYQQRAGIPLYESTIRTADNSERIVEARATFITLEDSQSVLLAIIRDSTARKHVERAISS